MTAQNFDYYYVLSEINNNNNNRKILLNYIPTIVNVECTVDTQKIVLKIIQIKKENVKNKTKQQKNTTTMAQCNFVQNLIDELKASVCFCT